jgi:hypothetical protein
MAYVRDLDSLTEWGTRWVFGQSALRLLRFPDTGTQDSLSLLYRQL